jgi:hypothetical protein
MASNIFRIFEPTIWQTLAHNHQLRINMLLQTMNYMKTKTKKVTISCNDHDNPIATIP